MIDLKDYKNLPARPSLLLGITLLLFKSPIVPTFGSIIPEVAPHHVLAYREGEFPKPDSSYPASGK